MKLFAFRPTGLAPLAALVLSASGLSAQIAGDLLWSTTTGGVLYSTPTIDANDTIYIGSGDKKLYAIESNGSVKWTYTAGDWVDSTPALADDGTIYVGSWDNKLHAVDKNGSQKWTFTTNSAVTAGPAVGVDGTIYFGSHDNFFYAIEANGSKKWEYYAGQPISSSAAIGQDGTIYFGDGNGTFHALNPSGTVKWTYAVEQVVDANLSIESSPALDLDGNLYFGSANGFFYSLEDNGTGAVKRWDYETGDRVDSSPVLGPSGEVYFAGRDGYLRSLDTTNGIPNWEEAVGDVFYSSPVVDANGTVYVASYAGSGENHIFAFESNGSLAWTTNVNGATVTIGDVVDAGLVLGTQGALYVASFDKKLHAIYAGSTLGDTDWPKFRRDLSGTGRWPSFVIDANVSPTAGGTVTGAGTYNQGKAVSLTAVPATGYTFANWSGDANGTTNPVTVTADKKRTVTAIFTLNSYLLDINASPAAGGTVSGDGNFTHDTNATITATPATGYFFAGWSGAGVADVNATTTTVSMTQTRNVSAIFTLKQYVLQATSGSGGTVVGSGTYSHDSNATITATPNAGHSFAGWTGAGVADVNASSTTVSMTQDRNVSAAFSINKHILTLTAGTGGTVSGAGSFDYNTSAAITATPATGHTFAGWTGAGVAATNSATTTVSMTQDRNVSASFTINSYALTLAVGTGGTVSGSGTYTHGSDANITATPATGYKFTGWTGSGAADANAASTTVSMTQARSLTANFTKKTYTLAISGGTGGTTTGSGTFEHGTDANVSAAPSTGYVFAGWSGAGVADINASTTTVSMTEDRNASASFSIKSYALNLAAGTGGTVSGAGTYTHGTDANVSATPATGYKFTGWTGAGAADDNAASTTVSMTQARSLTANFATKTHLLTIAAGTGGIAVGGGIFDYNTSATITATPAAGHSFAGWTGNGPADPNATTTTVFMTQDRNVSAAFSINKHALTVSAGTGGTVTGAGSFDYNSTASITATPATGYVFAGWTGAGVSSPNSPSTIVSMTQDRNVSASFSIKSYALALASGTGGSISGSGTFTHGTDANVSATPSTGYVFAGWTGAGVADANATTTTVSMTEDRNISASFSINSYALALTAGTGGSVTGEGTFTHGTSAAITATPDTGYTFSGWTGSGIANSGSASTAVSMTQDRNVSAAFTLIPANQVAVSVSASPAAGGSVTGSGTINEGTSAAITATPGTGYAFHGWSASGGTITSPASTSTTFTPNNSVTFATATANFSQANRKLLLAADGNGSVSGAGSLSHGTDANLTATAATGHSFTGWEVNGSVEYAVTVSSRQHLSANAYHLDGSESPALVLTRGVTYLFKLDGSTTAAHPFFLTTGDDGSAGYVGEYLAGVTNSRATSGSLTFTPDASTPATLRYRCGAHAGMGGTINVVDAPSLPTTAAATLSLTADLALLAKFSRNQYALTVQAGTGGSASGAGTYSHGTEANVSATPSTGYVFSGWSGAGVADANASSTTVFMTQTRSITANFETAKHLLSLTVSPAAAGVAAGAGTYIHGASANLSAIPATGYRFLNWTGGVPADANASATTLTLTAPASLTANFEKIPYLLTAAASPTGSGTVTGTGTHLHGASVTLSATPAAGYLFDHWSGLSFTNPSAAIQTFTADANRTLTANFKPKSIQVNVSATGPGSASGSGSSTFGTTVNLSATPQAGSSFLGWQTTSGTLASPASLTTTLTLNQDATEANATARFAANPRKLVLTAEGNGTTSGAGSYETNSSVPIAATAATGHQFAKWELNGSVEYLLSAAPRQLATGNAYFLDGRESPALVLARGVTYLFKLDGNTTVAHPLFLTTGDDASAGYIGEYLSGVTNSRATSGTLTFTPDASTPTTLRYRCGAHAGMGGTISVVDFNATPASASANLALTTDLALRATFTHQSFALSVQASGGGAATGSGSYLHGSDANLTATANVGYKFVNWTGPGVADTNASTTSAKVTSDATITANFEPATHLLTLVADPAGAGQLAGAGIYGHGATAPLAVVPATGYKFLGWTGGTTADANATSTTHLVSAPLTLTAKFEKLRYNLSVTVQPLGAATITGTGTHEHGTVISLVATPIKSYRLTAWSGAALAAPTSLIQNLTVTENLALTATFERHPDAGTLSHAISATSLEAGWKQSSWFGLFHQTTGNWAYHENFGWIHTTPEDDDSIWFYRQKLGWLWTNKSIYPYAWQENTYSWQYFSRLANGSFAHYDYASSSWKQIIDEYEIKVVALPSNGGTVSGGGTLKKGETATLTATPAQGYQFSRWFGDATGSTPTLTLTVEGDLIIYAEFTR